MAVGPPRHRSRALTYSACPTAALPDRETHARAGSRGSSDASYLGTKASRRLRREYYQPLVQAFKHLPRALRRMKLRPTSAQPSLTAWFRKSECTRDKSVSTRDITESTSQDGPPSAQRRAAACDVAGGQAWRRRAQRRRVRLATVVLVWMISTAACGAKNAPTGVVETPTTPPNTSVLFGQHFTWPDGPTLVVLQPRLNTNDRQRVDVRLRITAGPNGFDPATELHLGLTARGQQLAPLPSGQTGGGGDAGLPETVVPGGSSSTTTVEFAAPPDEGGWQCTATLRGSPLVVTYSEDI